MNTETQGEYTDPLTLELGMCLVHRSSFSTAVAGMLRRPDLYNLDDVMSELLLTSQRCSGGNTVSCGSRV